MEAAGAFAGDDEGRAAGRPVTLRHDGEHPTAFLRIEEALLKYALQHHPSFFLNLASHEPHAVADRDATGHAEADSAEVHGPLDLLGAEGLDPAIRPHDQRHELRPRSTALPNQALGQSRELQRHAGSPAFRQSGHEDVATHLQVMLLWARAQRLTPAEHQTSAHQATAEFAAESTEGAAKWPLQGFPRGAPDVNLRRERRDVGAYEAIAPRVVELSHLHGRPSEGLVKRHGNRLLLLLLMLLLRAAFLPSPLCSVHCGRLLAATAEVAAQACPTQGRCRTGIYEALRPRQASGAPCRRCASGR
mmetsp:Transcript_71090/g.203730  ORF Transcript_71090/g.203730 Transcript_71090/m.203730 type:complete len:304 (-) Transcript_71090:14-925(-)